MRTSLSRIMVGTLILLAGYLGTGLAWADPPQQVASVDELKSEAFKAIRDGRFDRSSELLTKAATLSQDPHLLQMAQWTSQFQTQESQFAAQRRKEFDQHVSNVHLLLDHKMDSYAIDEAARAFSLSDDKTAFRAEKWVDNLVNESVAAADAYGTTEQWLKSLRIYSDLASMEPANPQWKDKLKLTTRRVRLLMVYAPPKLRVLQELEAKDREAADRLLLQAAATRPSIAGNSTTQPATQPSVADAPATQPATQPAVAASQPAGMDEADGASAVDWHDAVKGADFSMVWESMKYADQQWYRDVDFQTLSLGGLNGLRTMATTKGLESTFPGLGDAKQRDAFIQGIDTCLEDARTTPLEKQEETMRKALDKLMDLNRDTVQLPDEVFYTEYADGALGELDPFSTMIWPYDLEEFQKTTSGEFGGVGIQIQNDDDGSLKIVSPLEDTPAFKAGLKAGDIITHINGKNAKGMLLDRAVRTITGVPGTPVVLTIRSPDGVVKDYTIIRELIKVDSIKGYSHKIGGGWDYFVDPSNKVAYIRLTNFTKSTPEDLDKALSALKREGAQAMILDLRYDPGGLLTAAIQVVNKFINHGDIVSTKADRHTPNMPTRAEAEADADQTSLPLVVLVNQYSASASEIVSGALHDNHRAILVGERTYGKGSVQMLFPLEGKSAFLKLTTSHYYLPSGRCIHREENSTQWGVDPDVTVTMTPDQMRAAIDARQDHDVLHFITDAQPTTAPAHDLLASDPQLSAALLMLRLELAGAELN